MQDDLLIKFIDGNCNPEEDETIIRELSREGEDSREWIQMQTASSLAGAKPFETVRAEDALCFVSGVIERDKSISARRRLLRWTGFAAGLCAAAASVAIILTVGRRGDGPGLPEPGDKLAFVEDSLDIASNPTMPEKSGGESRETRTTPPENILDEPESSVASVPQAVPSVNYDRNASKSEVSDSVAVQPAEERTLRMVRPSKSPYRVKVLNLSKDFVFEWEAAGAVNASLVVKDWEGMILIEEKIENLAENRIPVSLESLTDKGELIWTLALDYPDGGTVSRTGRLELKSALE
ncbi:MAG: hypothetical protein ACI4UJ_12755 [Candidatus Cryptobacteroides sp.]